MTAVIIIVGLALAIAGYCIGFYSGANSTMQKVLEWLKEFNQGHKR